MPFSSPAPKRGKRSRRAAVDTYFALLGSTFGLVLSILGFVTYLTTQRLHRQPPAAAKIHELDRVRDSLRELDKYVRNQQASIANAESALAELRRQKSVLDKVVSINSDAAKALLVYQSQHDSRQLWIGSAISFVLGVFSSLTATLLVAVVRRRRRTIATETMAPAKAGESDA